MSQASIGLVPGAQPVGADPTAQLLYQLVGAQMLQKLMQEYIAQITPEQKATLHEAFYQRMLVHARSSGVQGTGNISYALKDAVENAMRAVASSVADDVVAASGLRERYESLVQQEIERGLTERVKRAVDAAVERVLGDVTDEIARRAREKR